MKAAIVGIAGPVLTPDEAALLRRVQPAGVILFSRNVVDPGQLGALIAALRTVLPRGAVLLVDQEGGRVARLRPPHWRAHPAAATIGTRFAADPAGGLRAAWLTGALIGIDCARAGFDVVCAPVLDLGLPGAHSVIGDRAFGPDPEIVARLGRAVADGLLAAGMQPVGKHAPGHGRALADSHAELPVVDTSDLASDFAPFAANADLPWLMTAHIIYGGLDPEHPATLSCKVIAEMLRGRFHFDGVLVSDDLSMRALAGPPAASTRAALAAGCDLALYGAGDFATTEALLLACPPLRPESCERLAAAASLARNRRQLLDADALGAERDRLLT